MGIFQSIQGMYKKIWKGNYYKGEHEIQVSEGGEADLHKHLSTCEKNPGHAEFVPINDFNISHLPLGYDDDDTCEYIKATADLTVRIAVEMTSAERPEFWPNAHWPYPLYNNRESDRLRTGTGMVRLVFKWTEGDIKKYNMGSCACLKCQTSDTPSNEWGVVWMYTAAHVVFDKLEARYTTCRLFYDTQESPLVTLGGWTMMSANVTEDWCKLKCVTCDLDSLDKLIKILSYRNYLWRKLNGKSHRSRAKDNWTFIVSHPHGCSKQVTIGRWIDRWRLGRFSTKYRYTTCTCKGSSGAYVHSLGFDWSYVSHVHSGVNSEGQNYCSTGWDF